MTYFVKQGTVYRPIDEGNLDVHKILPAGNYVIKMDQNGNLFLETVDSFQFTTKRYGKNVMQTERIISTFLSRPSGTGIILSGEKGSGKSLLAKTVSMEAATRGIPTILINSPMYGDQFNAFIQGIDQPAVILFDEFEKVYSDEDQEKMLTLLDGVFPTKKLFIITCNQSWRIDQHMRNRPGRIFYMLDFKGLDRNFIAEYCNDNLNNKTYIERICNISALFNQFNFDMLKALIEEMNRYDCTPDDALEWLNARPQDNERSKFTFKLEIDGAVMSTEGMMDEYLTVNPMSEQIHIHFHPSFDEDPVPAPTKETAMSIVSEMIHPRRRRRNSSGTAVFVSGDIKDIDAKNGVFTLINPEGYVLTLKKVPERAGFDMRDAF